MLCSLPPPLPLVSRSPQPSRFKPYLPPLPPVQNVQVRSTGPNNQLTKQPIKGRKFGGGIRLGEMERDSLLAHGAAYILHDRCVCAGPGVWGVGEGLSATVVCCLFQLPRNICLLSNPVKPRLSLPLTQASRLLRLPRHGRVQQVWIAHRPAQHAACCSKRHAGACGEGGG